MAKIDDYGDRECPVCGKIFFTWSMDRWGYKLYNRQRDRYRLYCSWTCLREAQKKQKKVKLHRKREKVTEAELTGNHMKIKEATKNQPKPPTHEETDAIHREFNHYFNGK